MPAHEDCQRTKIASVRSTGYQTITNQTNTQHTFLSNPSPMDNDDYWSIDAILADNQVCVHLVVPTSRRSSLGFFLPSRNYLVHFNWTSRAWAISMGATNPTYVSNLNCLFAFRSLTFHLPHLDQRVGQTRDSILVGSNSCRQVRLRIGFLY